MYKLEEIAEDHDYCTFQTQNITDSDRSDQMRLREAIRNRNKDLVEHLVAIGTQANGYCLNISYNRPLHLAVISKSPEIVKILLNGGADVNVKSRSGDTPLTLAAKMHDFSIVDLLLSSNVKNYEDAHYNLNHLHVACMRNKISVVRRLLLENRAIHLKSPVRHDSMCWPGFTPLHFAAQYGCIETVKLLLKCGADITAMDARQMTPLHLADSHRNEEIIDLILREHKHELRNPVNAQGMSHFHIACTRDDASVINHFLKSGVDVNLKVKSAPWTGWEPIHFATYYECSNVIELLLSKNIHLSSAIFFELLKLSFMMGNERIHDLFTAKRTELVDLHTVSQRLSDLYQACVRDNAEKVEELLSEDSTNSDSYLNSPIWYGCTLLHLAVRYNSVAVLKILLDRGADSMIQNAQGKTSLHIAFENSDPRVVNSILKTLVRFSHNLTDDSGLSIFHILCTTHNVEAVESFISQGVDIHAQVRNESMRWAGFTPLHFATKFLKHKNAIVLLKNHADISIRNGLNLNPIDLLMDDLEICFDHEKYESEVCETLMAIFSSCPQDIKNLNFKAVSPLHVLCMNKTTDVETLNQYLVLHPNDINRITDLPNSRKSHKCTALHLALQRHHFGLAKLLLEKGADPLMVNNNGETPLESAAFELGLWWDTSDIDSLFVIQEINERFRTSHFHLACALGLTEVVKYILNKTNDHNLKMKLVNFRNDAGKTPLHSLFTEDANKNSRKQIALLLLENGAHVNARDFEFATPLHLMDSDGLDVVRALVSYGADVNAQNLCGTTPLHVVSCFSQESDKVKIISLLLESGADINIVDKQGRTNLLNIFNSHTIDDTMKECIVLLLKHVKKLEVIGHFVNDVNKKAYSDLLREYHESFDDSAFVRECEKEVDMMKSMTIGGSLTLHDILFMSLNRMVFHSKNAILQTLVSTNEIFERFPIYGSIIRLQMKNGRTRGPLLIESEKSLILLARRSLPSVCSEMIVQCLSNSDLKNIIRSVGRSAE